jgi:hypothetical protein
VEYEIKVGAMEEFLKLALKMIEYNQEHFNHNVELLLPESGKINHYINLTLLLRSKSWRKNRMQT